MTQPSDANQDCQASHLGAASSTKTSQLSTKRPFVSYSRKFTCMGEEERALAAHPSGFKTCMEVGGGEGKRQIPDNSEKYAEIQGRAMLFNTIEPPGLSSLHSYTDIT